MKIKKVFIYFFAAFLIILYVVLEIQSVKSHDWSPGYGALSREPLGCSALYDFLPDLFPSNELKKNNSDFYLFLGNNDAVNENLIVITDVFMIDKTAGNKLLEWIRRGNNAFISAGRFSDSFCHAGGFIQTMPSYNMYLKSKPDTTSGMLYSFRNEPQLFIHGPWNAAELCADTVFECDTLMHAQDSYNEPFPVFLQLHLGNGNLFVHGAPFLFSNYVLHDSGALKLAEQTLLLLPDAPTVWDEYYKPGNQMKNSDGMGEIFERASLKAAWQLLILLMLLYIVFVGKRRQKAIPVIEPPVNTSVEYIRTLGRLYFEKRNNRDILNKRLHFLLMTIKMKFSIDCNPDDPKFARNLMMATGAAENEINKLIQCFRTVQNVELNSQSTLKISREIDLFYKKYIH